MVVELVLAVDHSLLLLVDLPGSVVELAAQKHCAPLQAEVSEQRSERQQAVLDIRHYAVDEQQFDDWQSTLAVVLKLKTCRIRLLHLSE